MKKILKTLLISFALILLTTNAMAAVTLAWDAWTTADGVKPEGYFIYWKIDGQVTPNKSADTGFVNQFTIPDVFTTGTTYTFYATAWTWDSANPQSRIESGPSNTVTYVNRGDGKNYPPGTTVGAPTNFNVINQTTVSWTAATAVSPTVMPYGYRVYGYKTVGGSVASAVLITEGTGTTSNIGNYNFELNVEYKLFVKGYVYGVDGISAIESTNSNEDFYVKRTATSPTAPTAPKNMKIKTIP
jgi:hypothetical protein